MKKFLLVGIFVFSFLIGTDRIVLAKEGFFLGLNIPYTTIEGDFDGSSSLVGTQDAIATPRIKGAFGVGMVAGVGIGESFEIQLDISDTVHNAEWAGFHGDAEHRTVGLHLKHSFLTTETIQPFITYGITYDELIIKDGSVNTSGRIDDATFTGLGLDFGIGGDHYFNPRLSVGGTLMYHYVEYDQAKGVDESGKIDNKVNGSGLGIILNAAVHF